MALRSRLLSFVVLGAGTVACANGSESPLATNDTNDTRDMKQPSLWWGPGDGIAVFPQKVFVGFDESGSMASAPVVLSNASGTVTWTSSDRSIAAVSGGTMYGQISAVGPGITDVRVTADEGSASVFVVAVAYTQADVKAGARDYATLGCGRCHDGAGAPDITPSGIAKHSDDEIIRAALEGKNPEGGEIRSPNHRYAISAAIVPYLRSLPAQSATPGVDE